MREIVAAAQRVHFQHPSHGQRRVGRKAGDGPRSYRTQACDKLLADCIRWDRIVLSEVESDHAGFCGYVMTSASICLPVILLLASVTAALAQFTSAYDPTPPGTLNPEPLPPLPNPNAPNLPARELFARKLTPLAGPARAIGSYADGCMTGAVALPISGPTWEVMRLSRDRNWGNPELIKFIERLGSNAKKAGWNGLLIGDMAQPRGGPMLNGHSSHQIGLDVDIWFTPMPNQPLTRADREFMRAVSVVALDGREVNRQVWTPGHMAVVRAAAEDPAVTRIFVNAAIKKEMCSEAGEDRGWLAKVRPWSGHSQHFHVRLRCPADSPHCKDQPPVPSGDGCGHALDAWFRPSILQPRPPLNANLKPGRKLTLAGLPRACRAVVMAP
jgi:penicillin-insensitive murein DD-endopeptidase